ncbi:histidine kinase [Streptomyces sp. ODS28]|uniref:sensor histidine kinase n=1 Tax=Streptomyces sp. ODS28 TaxID=3136688 RepID=UPI0031E88980
MRTAAKSLPYALAVLPTALASLLIPPLLALGVVTTGLGGLGLLLVPKLLSGVRRWAEWHRCRAAVLLGVEVTARRSPLPKGVRAQWKHLRAAPETRRDLRWVPRHIGTGLLVGLLTLLCAGIAAGGLFTAALWWTLPSGSLTTTGITVDDWTTALAVGGTEAAAGAALLRWAVPALARLHARTCLAALEPSAEERLAERIGELTESRAGALDAHGAELRRIERDLHDGTQARLVAIAMRLGVAREALDGDSEVLAKLLREAHEGAEEAMAELRHVIRTMYPPVLADRGLAGAVSAATAGCGIPAEATVGDLGRLPAAVEAAAYFIVTECLTNAAKHSGASRVAVRLSRGESGEGDRLLIEVTDEGLGGVDESRGSGVLGIRRRAAALDGTVLVSSPVGGPTAVTVELPCGS